ncbi:MAG: phenylalanine-4-hydroxylase [Flavobacteriaceae bacterium]
MIQDMNTYTAEDLWVWNKLFTRQFENIPTKASESYLEGLKVMKPVLNASELPDFKKIGAWFEASTSWTLEVVPGLIDVEDFFKLLAQKKFCSSTWLRGKDSLDYLEEPDMFHDIFGHVPLLSNPVFSAFMQEFAELGCQFIHDPEKIKQLQRLYWFTIEFGVIQEHDKIQSYGAGILSSFGETNQIAEQKANFHPFEMDIILQKEFRTDVMQEDYFVIDSYEQLFQSLQDLKKTWTTNAVMV